MKMPVKMHLLSGGRALCVRGFSVVQGMPRKAFFELDSHNRCARCEAKARKAGMGPKIVADDVEAGSKAHLDALSRFFGL